MFLKVVSQEGEDVVKSLAKAFPGVYQIVEESQRNPDENQTKSTDVVVKIPTENRWALLVAEVKESSMTHQMKIACLAQAALESGWGRSKVAEVCLNFWGIKMRDELGGIAVGQEVAVTSESDGRAIFAKFPAVRTAVAGWLIFLSRPYYRGWEAYKNDAEGFIRHIGQYWCPVKGYAEKVIDLFPEIKRILDKDERIPALFDPGHSESRIGARSSLGAEEEDLNRLQADRVKGLVSGKYDVEIYDPLADNLYEIGKRAAGKRLFISYHHNSYDGSSDPGAEIFIAVGDSKSRPLAEKILDNICKKTGLVNRGVKEKDYTVIDVASKICEGPSMLIESYFLNPYSKDEAEKRSLKCADAIAETLLNEV
jgi:hypothetical protein